MARPTLIPAPGLLQKRIDRLWSQRTLAKKSGVAVSTISRIERGGRARLEVVAQIAGALGVEPAELTVR